MTNMSQTSFLAEIIDGDARIPESKLAYLRERQRGKFFDLIVSSFLRKEKNGELSKAKIARRLGKRPEQITRMLSTPGNWTLDTISDLVVSICGAELELNLRPFSEMAKRNCYAEDLLPQNATEISSSTYSVTMSSIIDGCAVLTTSTQPGQNNFRVYQ